jgi:hypothetical protein
MGKIGDAKRNVSERFLDFSEGSLGVLNAIPQLLHRRHGRFSRFFGSAQPGHLFRAFIELIPELLDLRRRGSPLFAQLLDISPRDVVPASSESSANVVEIFAEIFQIVHKSPFKKRLESSTRFLESQ